MKTGSRIGIGIAGILVLWIAAAAYASRAGEVVVLTTTDASGVPQKTPLWIVEHGGNTWLRAGSEKAGWLARLRANPRIEIERAGVTHAYHATLVPEATGEINAQMAEKYGFADRLLGYMVPGSRSHSMAVRLDPDS